MTERLKARALPDASTLRLDPADYYRQDPAGYFKFPCSMGEGAAPRRSMLYLPENSVFSQPTVFIMPPSGSDDADFLMESGWKELADELGLYLVVLEPEGETWKEDETDYLAAVVKQINARPYFSSFNSYFFAIAYGDAAGPMGRYSRRYPKSFAGTALFGTKGMSAEEKVSLEATPSPVKGVLISEIQLPLWAVAEEKDAAVIRLLDYYKAADHSQPDPVSTDWADEVYMPDPNGSGSMDEDYCAKVALTVGSWRDYVNKATSRTFYLNYILGYGRYPGTANAFLRYDGPMAERGFRLYSEMVPGGFKDDGSDLYQRLWWVYTPDTVDPQEKVPAVIAFHGAGGFGIEMPDRSGWARVARKHGFILICPCASHDDRTRKAGDMVLSNIHRTRWNSGSPSETVPGELQFLDYLYRWIIEHLNVDASRIYASGQSSGGMMAWSCACYRPDYFAAVAPFSANTPDIMSKEIRPITDSSPLPVMANLGLEDSYFPGGFSVDTTRELIEHWSHRYGLDKDWSDFRFGEDGSTASFSHGLFHHFVLKTSEGVPMMHLVETDTKVHAIWPSECEMVWEYCFSRFSKDPKTGKLYYEGKPVSL